MSPDSAEKFVSLALRHTGDWNALLIELEKSCDPAEFKELKHVVGHLLGTFYFEVLKPIHAEHPNAIPAGLEIG